MTNKLLDLQDDPAGQENMKRFVASVRKLNLPNKPILIVEDDKTVRENLQEFLECEGFSVSTASNGKEGLNLIREFKGRCLVLLDLQMPVMTGEQLLDELLQEPDPEVAAASVVIITARVEPVNYEVLGFLRKPLDLDLLLMTVKKFL